MEDVTEAHIIDVTETQIEVFKLLAEYAKKNGRPPTMKELADIRGVSTDRGILTICNALAKHGFLDKSQGNRGFTVSDLGADVLFSFEPIGAPGAKDSPRDQIDHAIGLVASGDDPTPFLRDLKRAREEVEAA